MGVIQMTRRPKEHRPREDAALRRLAIQIAGQLPESPSEALEVLEYCKTLVRSFLAEPEAV